MSRYRKSRGGDDPQAFERLLEALRRLMGSVASRRGRDTRRAGELSFAQFRLAAQLHEHGAMTTTRLADAAQLSPGAASEMLDGLERAGIVRRTAPDDDRRARVVSLSPEGRRAVEERRRAFRAELADALEGCTEDEVLGAAKVIDRLAEMFARR